MPSFAPSGRRSGRRRDPKGLALRHTRITARGYRGVMAEGASEARDPAILVTNPDEDCSPEAFRALLEELLSEPEPELESIRATEALHSLRTDANA